MSAYCIEYIGYLYLNKMSLTFGGEKWNQDFCQAGDVVKRETIEHLSHIKAGLTTVIGQGLSNLLEHCVVINIDLNERRVLTIDKCQIAIYAVIGTTI